MKAPAVSRRGSSETVRGRGDTRLRLRSGSRMTWSFPFFSHDEFSWQFNGSGKEIQKDEVSRSLSLIVYASGGSGNNGLVAWWEGITAGEKWVIRREQLPPRNAVTAT